uniref:Uncharacterized protein n=1 Tax=Tanacetum cinerariifolium TaxID=118510 RepID=A0A6L2LJY9_TANCI|nr:hypothetical protein [Tanacetum cinerariifolium]
MPRSISDISLFINGLRVKGGKKMTSTFENELAFRGCISKGNKMIHTPSNGDQFICGLCFLLFAIYTHIGKFHR